MKQKVLFISVMCLFCLARLLTDAFDLIHEEFHVMGATLAGDRALIVARDYTRVSRLSLLFLLSGYWGELLLYWGCSFIGSRVRGVIGSAFLGIYIAVFLKAMASGDFKQVAAYTGHQNWIIPWVIMGLAGGVLLVDQLSKASRRKNAVLCESESSGGGSAVAPREQPEESGL